MSSSGGAPSVDTSSTASPHHNPAMPSPSQGGATPTLNTLLSKPVMVMPPSSSGVDFMPPPQASPSQLPPGAMPPPQQQFASPQQSPVPNGSSRGKKSGTPSSGTPSRPESRDRYAATANAVAAGAGNLAMQGPARHPQVAGVQQQWQPRSPASPANMGGPMPPHPGYPPTDGQPHPHAPPPHGYPPPGHPQGYPPPQHYQHPYWQNRGPPGHPYPPMPPPGAPPGYGYPGQPPPQHLGYPPSYPPHPAPPPPQHPGVMRPPGPPGPTPQGDLVKMPNGPTPTEWAKMHNKEGAPSTPAGVPAPSPSGGSSVADESLDESKSPSWSNQGQRTPMPPGAPVPPAGTPQQQAPPPPTSNQSSSKNKDVSIVDRLVGPPSVHNPPRVMPERRAFFERLVAFCEQNGEPITMPPQVSKQNIDLHRLYIAVRNKGGFEQVTKDKAWKMLCPEANPEISESSAAGYQLRRHYQKYLLLLECMETGRNAEDAVAFADKLKKKKKEKEPQAPPPPQGFQGPPGQPPTGYPPPGHEGYYYQQGHPGQGPPPGWPGPPPPGAPPQGYPPGYRMPPNAPTMRGPPQQHMMPPGPEGYEDQRVHYYQQPPPHPGYPGGPPPQCPPPQGPSQPPPLQGAPSSSAAPAPSQAPAPSPHPPPSTSSNSLQVETASGSQAGSRAPSTGPPPGSSTPDSVSRHSANDEQRPSSHAAPTPSTSMSAPMPPQQSAPAPAPPQQGYYGQAPAPQLYGAPNAPGRPGPLPSGPPGAPMKGYGPPASYPGYPPMGYAPAGPPAGPGDYSQSHMHQQAYMHSQQMWSQQQQGARPAYPPPQGPPRQGQQPPSGPPRPYYPPQQMHPSAPSPGQQRIPPARYPPTSQGPSNAYPQYPPQSQQGRMGTQQPNYIPQSSANAPGASASHPLSQTSHTGHQPVFPPGSVEATIISQKRHRKVLSRDLIGVTPRRLLMALRSGVDTEVVWALNALNVLLYDDQAGAPAPALPAVPSLLSVLVEHLWATLAVLYPDTFHLDNPSTSVDVPTPTAEEVSRQEDEEQDDDVRLIVTPRAGSSAKAITNFTSVTRTGRKVHMDEVELPVERLKELVELGNETTEPDDPTLRVEYIAQRTPLGLGGGLAERLAARYHDELEWDKMEVPTKFFVFEDKVEELEKKKNEKTNGVKSEVDEAMEESEGEKSRLFFTRHDEDEKALGTELKHVRPTALCRHNQKLYGLTRRCLAISNILRGYTFLPGNEAPMCRHQGLLYLIGRFLLLNIEEKPIVKPRNSVKLDVDAPPLPPPAPESYEESQRKAVALLEDDDHNRLLLSDTANQLREDAFVILCHLSVGLDLYDFDDAVSWPIFNGLLHWAVSTCAEAKDPLAPGVISPRNYSLEALCKMSVVEANIDLLLSTGPWSRIENFIKVLSKLLSMGEEVPFREFSICILDSVFKASEAACWVAAMESPAIHNLISFIEAADNMMHQVMQTHGMPALRDQPELMGTSVGMLRRAADALKLLTQVKGSEALFMKHQQRLLQFTMSQLMDARVAGMIAETLYEVQKRTHVGEENERKDEKENGETGDESPVVEENTNGEADEEDTAPSEETSNGGTISPVEEPKRKRSVASHSPEPAQKKTKLENGFPEKRVANGEIRKSPLRLKETHSAENGSSLTAVA